MDNSICVDTSPTVEFTTVSDSANICFDQPDETYGGYCSAETYPPMRSSAFKNDDSFELEAKVMLLVFFVLVSYLLYLGTFA